MMRKTMQALRGFIVAALVLVGTVAYAQQGSKDAKSVDPEAARVAYEVSQEIYSPFCPGKTLAMCTSSSAADVRRDIQEMAASGMDEKTIKETVIQEYGEEFRMVEAGASDNVPLFVGIGGGLLLAIVVVTMISRRREDDDEEEPAAASESVEIPTDVDEDDPMLSQLREEYRD